MSSTRKDPSDVKELFEQAVETFEAAFKTSIKIQEEVSDFLTDAMGQSSSPQVWRNRAEAMTQEAFPVMRKNIDEAVHVMNLNAKTSLELLQKAFDLGQSDSIEATQTKTREMWEGWLQALRYNTQAMVQANARVMESWTNLAKKSESPLAQQS